MKELKDTIALMTSPDYKERFRAEYWQTKIRYEKLRKILTDKKAGTLPFTLSCPVTLLEMQLETMRLYLNTLKMRALVEGVDLEVSHE